LIDSCGIADFSGIALYGSRGFDNGFIFDGTTTTRWDVYGTQTLGALSTDPDDSFTYDCDDNEITVKPTTINVKLGTRAYVSTKRSGKKVTIKVGAKKWEPKSEAYRTWNAPSAKIQYKSGSTWKTKKTVKLKNGTASYSYKTAAKRTYRFVTDETSTRFGATSSTSRR